jgi:hypothetical protein
MFDFATGPRSPMPYNFAIFSGAGRDDPAVVNDERAEWHGGAGQW